MRHCALALIALSAVAWGACRPRGPEVVVFCATSLVQPLGEVAQRFERDYPGTHVRLEPSGSQVAARKIAEHGMTADVVAVADAALLVRMLVPAHARHDVLFATDEIVIAHKDHSRYTDEITTENWADVLRRPGLRLARADADTAPVGYHTLVAWRLAENAGHPDLYHALLAACPKQNVVPDEAELLAQLESRSIDYAFVYRSTAESHHLKITALPPELNLSRPELASRYAEVEIEVRMSQGTAATRLAGAPITYGLAIPTLAPHRDAADRFVTLLLGDAGRRVLERRGFHPSTPARCAPCDDLPSGLRALISSAP